MAGLVHKDDYYETPKWLVDYIKYQTGLKFNLDACANANNHLFDNWFSEEENALITNWNIHSKTVVFCNPPTSKNGKFVTQAVTQWETYNIDIVMLLRWNDIGNKYGQKYILPNLINKKWEYENLGKVVFYKNGEESKHPSRLNYFWCWMRSQ